jgi:hypothetical protein
LEGKGMPVLAVSFYNGIDMRRQLGLPFVAMLLVGALLISPSLGNIANSTTIQSTGAVSYISPPVVKLMGVDKQAWFWDDQIEWIPMENLVDMVADAGGNVWRQHMISALYPDSMTLFVNLKNILDQRGVKLLIATMGVDSWEFGFNWQEQADIIMNANGKGDKWINDWGQIIAVLQPYAIDVMNEPRGIGGTSYEATMTKAQFFEAYRQFCIRAIRAWRAIKPDLVIVVANCPFYETWTDTGFDVNPINEPNIIYSIHHYYAYDNTYPPSYLPEQRAYWDGNLVQAKTLLAQRIDYDTLAMRNKGFTIIYEEIGTNIANPNAAVYMQDFYDLCRERNIGVIHHCLAAYPRSPAGILNDDWTTLNSIGEVWARNMK